MNPDEQRAVLTLALMAAFADGANNDPERNEIKRIAGVLGADSAIDAAAIYEQVLLRKPDIGTVASMLTLPEHRQFAYEMAVGVCNSDGALVPAERDFLDRLATALAIGSQAQQVTHEADALASAPPAAHARDGTIVAAVPASDAGVDAMILNYSILNGALELLPQSLASMAIIPLQMKMVYAIGRAHGFELGREHIKEFLATIGVGMTSQYLEQFGRRLLGGLLGRLGGGLLGGVGSMGTGAAFSFASTYALGHVAKRYYAGGRNIDAKQLRETFTEMLNDAKQLQGRYTGQITEQARTLDLAKLLELVKR